MGKNHTFAKKVLPSLDYSQVRAREPFRKYNAKSSPWWHDDMEWPAKRCFASKNTKDSVRFIRNAKPDEPYFLHISYFDPHPPYFAPADVVKRYGVAEMKVPDYIPAKRLGARLDEHSRAMRFADMTPQTLKNTMRYYYAGIEWGVDQQVGLVLDALKETGQMANTIVVFTSDHGDFMGHHGMVRKGMFLYDDLLHVPLIYYAPGRIPPGRRLGGLAQGVDLFSTLTDLTGGEISQGLPGMSTAGSTTRGLNLPHFVLP
ncbi:MAG: sulfatase-like hydrolase/transferase [Nitrospiraceae bacterium]|nr:sulfatase-like hydrolase/transferase [Nitrospiraceae bacterium]